MSSRLVAGMVSVTFLSLTCTGCLSNEYVISKSELGRLASLPPGQRGAEVHVVQSFGEREGDAIDNPEPMPREQYVAEFWRYDRGYVTVQTPPWRAGTTVSPGSSRFPSSQGERARPPAERPRGIRGGSVNASGNAGGGGGGGGGGGDGLLVLAVVIVAVAALAAAGLAVTEGLRYDGSAQLHPEQPLRLSYADGREQTVSLAELTPLEVAASEKAVVFDDHPYGFRFGHRRPLDRKGMAFKVDFGSLSSLCACYSAVGFGSNIQLGYFPHHRLGVLGALAIGAGTDSVGEVFQRHSANLELQYFPLDWWRLHLGAFGHGGQQVARDEYGTRTGWAWGGGAILELALTTRLALTGRMDYTLADTAPNQGGWASTSVFSAGLAIY